MSDTHPSRSPEAADELAAHFVLWLRGRGFRVVPIEMPPRERDPA